MVITNKFTAGGAFKMMWQGVQCTYGKINHHQQRPPAVFLFYPINKTKIHSQEVAMIKKVRLIFDIEVTVTEIITPDLIEKAKTATNDGKHVQIEQKMLDMLQEVIAYVSRHKKHLLKCLSGELYSMLTEHGCDEELKKYLNGISFEQAIIEAAAGMEPEYETFIRHLYQLNHKNKGMTGDLEKGPTDALSPQQRDILNYILDACILNPKITGAKVLSIPGKVLHIDGEQEE